MHTVRKLLFYTHGMTGGGAERVWALLASGFVEAGHDVILAVDYAASANAVFIDPRVRIVVLGGGHAATVGRLARLIARERPDVTLSALGVSNIKHVAAALLVGRARRAVISYHAYFKSEPKLLSRLSYLATPLLTRLAARTVCVSDGLLSYLIATWHVDTRRTARIYNPVKVGGASARPDPDAPTVLAAGRLVPDKNFPALLRAFAALADTRTRLLILGEGPERATIQAEAVRLGIEHRLAMPGYVASPWDCYAAAACFVMTSLEESFAMVVVEALAFGLPVVATDCNGPREILADGRFGTLVPQGDTPALTRAIEAALADGADPAPRRARAAEFDVAIGQDHYGRLIDEIVSQAVPQLKPGH